ncbi:MAG TPA: GvpL/GvpF family gas vesicle protein [Bacteroidota bacterium]|nr:GvpL/GvpF family gas vesicle protein [Bacteroidota bacterium]
MRTPGSSVFGHTPFPFEDQRAYVLAASLIPLNDSPSSRPFHVGGPGFDEGTELFAVDHSGMRFYLSLLNNQDASVSTNGILLLNKRDVLRHRGDHERLINKLRVRSMILPAESGTVIKGKDDLVRRIDFRLHTLLEILLGLPAITTWHLHVSVLDSRVHQTLPSEAAAPRAGRQEREGGRGTGSHKHTDIKALDRLLTREKKLAETILQSIAAAAERHDVEYLIGLAGGSSDGWKLILKATFQVPPARYTHFAETVAACQEMHALIDPMFVLSGGTESFSLSL